MVVSFLMGNWYLDGLLSLSSTASYLFDLAAVGRYKTKFQFI